MESNIAGTGHVTGSVTQKRVRNRERDVARNRLGNANSTYQRRIYSPGRTISQGDPWLGLGAAVLIQAVRDVRSRDPLKSGSALMFLASDSCQLFLEALGLDLSPADLLAKLTLFSQKPEESEL